MFQTIIFSSKGSSIVSTMILNSTDTNFGTEAVSPVTLSADWSRVARLLLLASLAAIGSVGNVFMISAIMIEDYLRKKGNQTEST